MWVSRPRGGDPFARGIEQPAPPPSLRLVSCESPTDGPAMEYLFARVVDRRSSFGSAARAMDWTHQRGQSQEASPHALRASHKCATPGVRMPPPSMPAGSRTRHSRSQTAAAPRGGNRTRHGKPATSLTASISICPSQSQTATPEPQAGPAVGCVRWHRAPSQLAPPGSMVPSPVCRDANPGDASASIGMVEPCP